MRTRLAGYINIAAVVAAAVILSIQLLLPPVIGLANSGDFGKVTGVLGLGVPTEAEDNFKFVSVKYTFATKYKFSMGYVSSEHILAAAAVRLNALFRRDGSFDLRWMGIVHGTLVLLALALCPRRPVIVTLLILLIFGDVSYVCELNSFFMDAAAFAFLLLTIVFYLRRQGLWALITGILLVASKTPHAPLAVPLAGLFLFEGARLGFDRWNARLAAATMLVAGVFGWYSAGSDFHSNAAFNVIFWHILPASSDVSADLETLGLDDSYRLAIGMHAFSTGVPLADPQFRAELARRTSHVRIGWFYLKHPRRFWEDLRATMAAAGEQRPNLGNFEKNQGQPAFSQSRSFALWSDFKKWMFAGNGGTYLAAVAFLMTAALGLAWRTEVRNGIVGLIGMIAVELLAAGFGDVLDIPRHFFLFQVLVDVLLVATVTLLLRKVGEKNTGTQYFF